MSNSLTWTQPDLARMQCPNSGGKLTLSNDSAVQFAVSSDAHQYEVDSDILRFLDYDAATDSESESIESYAKIISYYDQAIEWLFASTLTKESVLRQKMVDELWLGPDSRVVEVGAGTGRDSIEILQHLGQAGQLYVQDISVEMLKSARLRLSECDYQATCRLFQGSAAKLPFDDGALDALYSFGGLNEFGSVDRVLAEFSRVVRVGGRVVVGDEGIAPWLEGSEHHRILAANNRIFFSNELPIDSLPENAADVRVQWVLGNAFYLISFTVGAGRPPLDLDIEHLGRRGGTLRTRYFGALDGVDPSLRKLVELAALRSGMSLRRWLEATLGAAVNTTQSGESR